MFADIEQSIAALRFGDHLCPIHENPAEQLAVAIPFIKQGLARAERCLYIGDERRSTECVEALSAAGVSVEEERAQGRLRLLSAQKTYLGSNQFDPPAVIDFLRQSEKEALAEGFTGLRIVEDMGWVLGHDAHRDRLITYEALLNEFLANSRTLAICQCDRERFPPILIQDVLRTHPVAIVGNAVCSNPFYEPPKLLIGEADPDEEVEWKIAQLRRARAEEEKLRESHAMLSAVVEGTNDAVFVKDRQGRCLMINSAGARFLGKSVEEALGKDSWELFASETARRVMQDDQRVMATGRMETFERVVTAAGVTRTHLTTKSPYRDLRGNIAGVIGVARDISESKAIEAERDALLRRLRLQIDRMPLAYILMDAHGVVLNWNPAAESIFGYSRKEALGRRCAEMIVAHPANDHLREVIRRIRSGDMRAHCVNQNKTRDGSIITCEWFNTPLIGGDGRFTGVISVASDVTERKRTEDALARDAMLLANVRDSVIVTDVDGIVTFWNDGATRLYGWRGEELLGKPFLGRLPQEAQKRMDEVARAVLENGDFSGTWEDYRKDGSRVWIDIRISRITDSAGKPTGLLRLSHDITDRKLAELDLRHHSERLQSLSRRLLRVEENERRSLARELHDEIGQNLTGLHLLLEAGSESAEIIKGRLAQAQAIVDDLFAKSRALAFDLRPAALDQLGLVPALLSLFERYTIQTRVRVDFKHSETHGRFAPEVETTAYRIVQEALTNVARHAGADEVAVRVWVSSGTLGLHIEDRGRGFAAAEELGSSHSSGLAGMYERAKLIGGNLTIESGAGRGTQITAELPLLSESERSNP